MFSVRHRLAVINWRFCLARPAFRPRASRRLLANSISAKRLGIHRSDDCIFFQITLNSGRSTELKQRFYKALADHLHEGVKIRKEDVLINFVEVPKENWSFGNGEAQYVTPPK